MDKLVSDSNGEANGEAKVSMTFINDVYEGEENGDEKESETSDENNQTDQKTTIKDGKYNSKSNEGPETDENDIALSTTNKETEKRSSNEKRLPGSADNVEGDSKGEEIMQNEDKTKVRETNNTEGYMCKGFDFCVEFKYQKRQGADEWAAKEDEYNRRLKNKDTKMADLKATIESLKKALKQETEKYEGAIIEKSKKETVNIDLTEKNIALQMENHRHNQETEHSENALEETTKSKKNKFPAFPKLWVSKKNELNGTIQKHLNQIHQQIGVIRSKDQFIDNLQKATATLQEECKTLSLRLSKLAGAHLTLNNPNITDLSDVNRPTNLAEKYSELYDNEWTDAFEEQTDALNMDEEACAKTMLDLLKTANDECLKLLQPHRDILKTLTVVTVKLDKSAVKQVPHDDQVKSNSTEDKYAQTDLIALDTDFEKEECQSTGEQVYANNKNVITVDESNDNEELMDTYEDNAITVRSQATSVDKLACETNVDTGEETAHIIINGEFTEEQKKAVSDMRKLCGTKLEKEGSISEVIAMKIARERRINIKSSKHMMTYITKCAQLCWYMAIQEPPVVIGFREPAADEYFNKDVYKAYTKVGKWLDYVVWPAVYLYKDGPMLCKGTAQGKD